jgi:hypothetical protein
MKTVVWMKPVIQKWRSGGLEERYRLHMNGVAVVWRISNGDIEMA